MKQEYEAYFAERFRELRRFDSRSFRGRPPYPPLLTDELLSRIPKNWRSDARFFLASNMLEMVVVPYDYIDGPDAALAPGGEVAGMIFSDLDRLIRASEETARQRGRDYVSATSVAIALGSIADELRTTSLQIWGPSVD